MKAWKAWEKRVCERFNAKRRPSVGPYGYARGSDDDGSCVFAIECKRTTRYQLRRAWWEQTQRNAKASGRPGLLAIGEHNDRRGGIGVMALDDIEAMARAAGWIE